MSDRPTTLLLGGSGKTGIRVLEQLLSRGLEVRAIVRSTKKLTRVIADSPRLQIVEDSLLTMRPQELLDQVRGCDAIVSCLGHNPDLKGVFGPPHDLITRATERVCRAIAELGVAKPVKFVLMSTVAVNKPGKQDLPRSMAERFFLWVFRGLVPPIRDHQTAADFLNDEIGRDNPFVQWVVVRPDTLIEGEVSEYSLHEGIVSPLSKPDRSAMSNVAHFICELITEPKAWDAWHGRMPVIVNGRRS